MWVADVLSQLGLHIAGKNMALIDIYHLHTILFIILSLKKVPRKSWRWSWCSESVDMVHSGVNKLWSCALHLDGMTCNDLAVYH